MILCWPRDQHKTLDESLSLRQMLTGLPARLKIKVKSLPKLQKESTWTGDNILIDAGIEPAIS